MPRRRDPGFYLLLRRSSFSLDNINQDSSDQDKTGDDLLPVCLQTDIRKSGLQKYNDKHTGKGSDNGSVTACSRYAADKYAADGIQLQTGSCSGLNGRGDSRIGNRRKSCEETSDHIIHDMI